MWDTKKRCAFDWVKRHKKQNFKNKRKEKTKTEEEEEEEDDDDFDGVPSS